MSLPTTALATPFRLAVTRSWWVLSWTTKQDSTPVSATPSPQAGNVVVALGPYHDRVTADRNGKAELLSTGSIESCQPGDLLPNIGATHVAFEHVD